MEFLNDLLFHASWKKRRKKKEEKPYQGHGIIKRYTLRKTNLYCTLEILIILIWKPNTGK